MISFNNKQNANVSGLSKIVLISVLDILATMVAFFFGLWMRFDFVFADIPLRFLEGYSKYIALWCTITVVVFFLFKLYSSIWVFVGTSEVLRIMGAYGVLAVAGVLVFHFYGVVLPRGSCIIGFVLSFCCTVGIRFSYRLIHTVRVKFSHMAHASGLKNIMLIGAGDAGRAIANELVNSNYVRDHLSCVIDDNPIKLHKRLCGVPIVGDRYAIPAMVKQYRIDKIIFAIPSCPARSRKEILDICTTTGCEVQMLPGIYQMVTGEVSVSKLRNVDPQDLLGRDPIQVNLDEIIGYISGKVVMVTGGGGSIGSELCRQIARANPRQLIIFDIYENNAYEIQQELRRQYPSLDLKVLIGSVRDGEKMEQLFARYRPQIVYHAAAHKHVPLMEDSPNEAVKNNVFGTWNAAQMADRYQAETFVLISTDKAVNPTSVMGATKRVCEMIVQMFSHRSSTRFVAVRFGNVLGSNGSVIPLFRKQIEQGGPVTVTHKEMIRYFMTIPEAVSLVLQAGVYAKGGEIFILDMGAPVKIDDLARNMIRLSGFEPDVDIPVVYTGLRPGEKLYEELLLKEEGLERTANDLIFVGHPNGFSDQELMESLALFGRLTRENSPEIVDALSALVKNFRREQVRS